jgi:fatty acid-binding protein DegV
MTYLDRLRADVIEENSKKLYEMIIKVYSLIKKTSITFILKNLMNNGRISPAGRSLVNIILDLSSGGN